MSKVVDSLMKAIEDLSDGYLGLDAFKNKNVYVNGILQEHVVYTFSDCVVVIQTDWKTGEFVLASPNDEDVWNGYALTRVKGTVILEDKPKTEVATIALVDVEGKPVIVGSTGTVVVNSGQNFSVYGSVYPSIGINPGTTTSSSGNIVILPWVGIVDS